MSEEEKKLYDILFPNDNNPYHINYAYFTNGTKRSLSILKAKIRNSFIDPIIFDDEVKEGSFFVRVVEKDVDIFLDLVKPLKYTQFKIPKRYMEKIKILFGDK